MTREFLKGLELSDEKINQIMTEHGKTVNNAKQGNEEANREKDSKIDLLTKKNEELQARDLETKKLLEGNQDLQGKFEALQNESSLKIAELEKQNKDIITNNLIEKELKNMGAVHPNLLKLEIDKEKIIIEDGKILNAETVFGGLKELYGDMFKQTKITGQEPNKSNLTQNTGEGNMSERQLLINAYNEAEKQRNITKMIAIQEKIKNIKEV